MELIFRQTMARPDVVWQIEQATRFEQSGDWYAAAFQLDLALTVSRRCRSPYVAVGPGSS
jgi:hypothetical protein